MLCLQGTYFLQHISSSLPVRYHNEDFARSSAIDERPYAFQYSYKRVMDTKDDCQWAILRFETQPDIKPRHRESICRMGAVALTVVVH